MHSGFFSEICNLYCHYGLKLKIYKEITHKKDKKDKISSYAELAILKNPDSVIGCNRPVRQVAYSAAGPEGTGWELWTGTKPLGPSVVVPRIACAPTFFLSSAAHLGAKWQTKGAQQHTVWLRNL